MKAKFIMGEVVIYEHNLGCRKTYPREVRLARSEPFQACLAKEMLPEDIAPVVSLEFVFVCKKNDFVYYVYREDQKKYD